jgi:hypothetical protein
MQIELFVRDMEVPIRMVVEGRVVENSEGMIKINLF